MSPNEIVPAEPTAPQAPLNDTVSGTAEVESAVEQNTQDPNPEHLAEALAETLPETSAPAPDATLTEAAASDVTGDQQQQPASTPSLSPAQTAVKLAELFPALFAGPPKPIKLRIQADLQLRAPGVFTKRVLSFFLSRHTTTTPYLKALVAETQRYDLDGLPAGEVTAEHKLAATEELARRKQIVEARRAAERAARPQRPPEHQQEARGTGRRHTPTPRTDAPSTNASNDATSDSPSSERPSRTATQRPRRSATAQAPFQNRGSRRDPSGVQAHAGQHERSRERGGRDQQRQPEVRPSRSEPTSAREWVPADPAQRDRAFLLRAWESSSLTKANFCALKRLSEADFDAQLELAKQERGAKPGR